MLHNHLRNFTSHELLIDLDSTDESDYGTDCINQFCAGIEISGHELCRFGDTCLPVSLRKYGGGCGNHECRRDDELLSDVLVHKQFLFCAVQRVDSPFSGG